MTDRDALRSAFIHSCGWGDAVAEALPVDFSLRTYYRLRRPGQSVIVMDAPPERGEDTRPFIRVDRHLIRLGLSAPEIYEADEAQGFLLLEDFDTASFTRLLAEGHDERALYSLAVDSIIALQSAPDVMDVDATSYMPHFVADLEWWLQFYVPERTGRPASDDCRARFYAAWDAVLASLPPTAPMLMLRDYHVDNLMLLKRPGVKACGLLDFQAAEFAPRSYDLICLLNDARREVPEALRHEMLARYSAALPVDEAFRAWYNVILAQRQMRVLGNVARQAKLLGRLHSKILKPLVVSFLEDGLRDPHLAPVRAWMERWL